MSWKDQLKGDPLSWLLEPENPGVRYLALRDLVDGDTDPDEMELACLAAHRSGPIATILDTMDQAGFWVEPGAGYRPKYQSTVWSMITLGQLGAKLDLDKRISTACSYVLDHAFVDSGQFTINGVPSGTVDCLQGNLCSALVDLGCVDARLDKAYEWMARCVTGEGVAPVSDHQADVRYYAGKCGPVFACGANNKLSCAWGGVKVMLAFSKLPIEKRTPLIERAIQQGLDFLWSTDPAGAEYPSGYSDKPSGNWWKFGFPIFYITDLLQNVEVLVLLGHGKDVRLSRALQIILDKQDARGRWALEFDYPAKTWVNYGVKKQPNKWVTWRALSVLRRAGE